MLLCSNALPPDPEIVGERWQAMWRDRLENAVLFPELWLHHPVRDEYWKHGSVCEDYGAIQCAVYAIGGWADAYRNAVPRLLEGLHAPRKGLIGPWCHAFPHDSLPGPSIGFLREALRWWDYWLKGVDTGIMDEPQYRVWMQEWVSPSGDPTERPGRWVAETQWATSRIRQRRLFLNSGRLARAPESPATRLALSSPQSTGASAGEWCAFGSKRDLPSDQREDDARSLLFELGTAGGAYGNSGCTDCRA